MELFGFLSFSKRFVKDILFVICSDIIKIIITCLNMGKKYIYFQSHLEHNHDQRMLSEIFVASKNVTCWWCPRASIRHPCSGSWAHPPHLAPWCPVVSRGSCRSLTTAISSEGWAYPLHQRLRTGHSNVLRKELQHLRILTTGERSHLCENSLFRYEKLPSQLVYLQSVASVRDEELGKRWNVVNSSCLVRRWDFWKDKIVHLKRSPRSAVTLYRGCTMGRWRSSDTAKTSASRWVRSRWVLSWCSWKSALRTKILAVNQSYSESEGKNMGLSTDGVCFSCRRKGVIYWLVYLQPQHFSL